MAEENTSEFWQPSRSDRFGACFSHHLILEFATKKPPRAYAGNNPDAAALARDRAQNYTQFVQLQNTERNLVDLVQPMQRNLESFFETYAAMRANEFRRAERITQVR